MQACSKNTALVQGYPGEKLPAGTVDAIIPSGLSVISTLTSHDGTELQYWKN